MAEILNEKAAPSTTTTAAVGAPQLSISTTTPAVITEPEKAAYLDPRESPRTSLSFKASHELHRDSNISTPRSYTVGNPFDTDIEAIIPTSSSQVNCSGRKSTTAARGDCQVWPGQDQWKKRHKAAKVKNRSCACMGRLSKRTRLIVKILIGLLIVGIAVGVGFGVSKPLGAPIWGKPNGS
jgi:hypothetical protein